MTTQLSSTFKRLAIVPETLNWPMVLTTGGDDRLTLDPETGRNLYHAKPQVAPDALFRGSCTCNSPTQLAYDAAERVHEAFMNGTDTAEASMQRTRQRIIKIYGLHEDTGVFVMPSGSDAEYIPLAVAKGLSTSD